MSAEKPKVAFYWCASCGGCEEAVVDLAERLLDAADLLDIVFWPVALDFKRADLEAIPDQGLFAAFVNGAVRTSEQEEMARLLRRKARVLVAVGACAQWGGVPGLANLYARAELLNRAYADAGLPLRSWRMNGFDLHLPDFHASVRSLVQTVDVDYSIPGCPPTPDVFMAAVGTLLGGELPPPGTVLAPDRALCEECPRKDSKPEDLSIERFHRTHEIVADETRCLLAQGLPCLGAATRAGCKAQCIQGNMPCTGCFGPVSRVRDFGAKALSGLASSAAGSDESVVQAALSALPDPAGLFYRYSLPASQIARIMEAKS